MVFMSTNESARFRVPDIIDAEATAGLSSAHVVQLPSTQAYTANVTVSIRDAEGSQLAALSVTKAGPTLIIDVHNADACGAIGAVEFETAVGAYLSGPKRVMKNRLGVVGFLSVEVVPEDHVRSYLTSEH